MARPNYSHGKRQRELAKKQKREDKMQRRLERKNTPLGAPVEETAPVEGSEPESPENDAGDEGDAT